MLPEHVRVNYKKVVEIAKILDMPKKSDLVRYWEKLKKDDEYMRKNCAWMNDVNITESDVYNYFVSGKVKFEKVRAIDHLFRWRKHKLSTVLNWDLRELYVMDRDNVFRFIEYKETNQPRPIAFVEMRVSFCEDGSKELIVDGCSYTLEGDSHSEFSSSTTIVDEKSGIVITQFRVTNKSENVLDVKGSTRFVIPSSRDEITEGNYLDTNGSMVCFKFVSIENTVFSSGETRALKRSRLNSISSELIQLVLDKKFELLGEL